MFQLVPTVVIAAYFNLPLCFSLAGGAGGECCCHTSAAVSGGPRFQRSQAGCCGTDKSVWHAVAASRAHTALPKRLRPVRASDSNIAPMCWMLLNARYKQDYLCAKQRLPRSPRLLLAATDSLDFEIEGSVRV